MTLDASGAPSDLTPKRLRAARALLAWSQHDLAKHAGVATSTVADFERGERTPVANNAQAMRSALEAAGVCFHDNGAVSGPDVPAPKASKSLGAPVRWVDADDLTGWADRNGTDARAPKLLSDLISASLGPAVQLRFPADGGTRHAGWDGTTKTEADDPYVPKGRAGWEISVQRSKISEKATEDFRKRTFSPGNLKPAEATFVFVTLRHWSAKEKWLAERRKESAWREVRAYDANDLVHWLERTPAVGLWLAGVLGKRPAGVLELDQVWKEWSLATQPPLTEDLMLSDRDQDAAEVLHWLRDKPSVLSLKGTSTDEVVAFFHATLSELPDDVTTAYRARTLVATTANSARALSHARPPLILLLTEPEGGLAQYLAERGHYVLQAYDERPVTRGNLRTLARPSREGLSSALTAAGLAEPSARALARDSARNLAVLRRRMAPASGRPPWWAQETPPRALLAALLAGAWDERSEGDRRRLAELADQTYEAVTAAVVRYVGDLDRPLRKIGSTWRIASPWDAWFLLAPNLTSADLTRFEAVAHAVLASPDPRFEMNPDERWMAPVHDIRPVHSSTLRHGVGQILILLALWGEKVHTAPHAARRADVIVKNLLDHADQRQWWSLSREFRLLAEASPDAFLTAIEDSLDQEAPPIGVLFGHDDGGLFGTEHLSDLMWALESLAWSPDLLTRVTRVLARLDALDTKPRRYNNGPGSSLREIHLLWNPGTHATLDQRLRALDSIRKHEAEAAWKLMLGVLPRGGGDFASPTSRPRWRDFSVETVEAVTRRLMERGAAAITSRLISDVGLKPDRWSELLDRLRDLVPDPEGALAALEAAEPKIPEGDRGAFTDKLRGVLHHHREFPGMESPLSAAQLDRLEAVYERFAPPDPLKRTAWLFEESAKLPRPSGEGWEADRREVDDARRSAARAVYDEGGVAAILSLARLVDDAGYIGKALVDSGLPASELDALLVRAVRSDDAHERALAHGLLVSVSRERGESWAATLIARARHEAWGDTALLAILRALPSRQWTWDQVASIGGVIEATYWRDAPTLWMSTDGEDAAYAIRKLLAVERARHALHLVHGASKKAGLPTDLLVEVLQEAARQPSQVDDDANEATMFSYYVAETLALLDQRSDLDVNVLVRLEWMYLADLEHSRRPAKVLVEALSEQPGFFIHVLSALFKPEEDSGVVEPEPENRENAHAVADHAYRLLSRWSRLPGTRGDGTIDGGALEAWISEARKLAKAAGRQESADREIGHMLSASPLGVDGSWPAEPVREVLDLFLSRPMIEGFRIGKLNRRGVTHRALREGGQQEREEAARYRAWARAIGSDHPHTAKVLRALADYHDREAVRNDEDVERLDGGP